jgi:hypothetical protein
MRQIANNACFERVKKNVLRKLSQRVLLNAFIGKKNNLKFGERRKYEVNTKKRDSEQVL